MCDDPEKMKRVRLIRMRSKDIFVNRLCFVQLAGLVQLDSSSKEVGN